MVVSISRGAPIYTPRYSNPFYENPHVPTMLGDPMRFKRRCSPTEHAPAAFCSPPRPRLGIMFQQFLRVILPEKFKTIPKESNYSFYMRLTCPMRSRKTSQAHLNPQTAHAHHNSNHKPVLTRRLQEHGSSHQFLHHPCECGD